jgi:hypothetical protein
MEEEKGFSVRDRRVRHDGQAAEAGAEPSSRRGRHPAR